MHVCMHEAQTLGCVACMQVCTRVCIHMRVAVYVCDFCRVLDNNVWRFIFRGASASCVHIHRNRVAACGVFEVVCFCIDSEGSGAGDLPCSILYCRGFGLRQPLARPLPRFFRLPRTLPPLLLHQLLPHAVAQLRGHH